VADLLFRRRTAADWVAVHRRGILSPRRFRAAVISPNFSGGCDVSGSQSPLLLAVERSTLLVIDVQEKLAPLVREPQRLVWNIRRLLDAASILGVPASATEQYPKGLGKTLPELASRLGPAPEKMRFSCSECEAVFTPWKAAERMQVVVTGMETHVCVQQTVLDLLHQGFRPHVVADAVSSRGLLDHEIALDRLRAAGAVITTTESVLFEWCRTASAPHFKSISALVRETSPQ
jgi:nicotinamidase-related amidase